MHSTQTKLSGRCLRSSVLRPKRPYTVGKAPEPVGGSAIARDRYGNGSDAIVDVDWEASSLMLLFGRVELVDLAWVEIVSWRYPYLTEPLWFGLRLVLCDPGMFGDDA